MSIMSRKQERLLEKLIELAGSVELVEEALRETARREGRAPRLEEVIEYIIDRRRDAAPVAKDRELEPA